MQLHIQRGTEELGTFTLEETTQRLLAEQASVWEEAAAYSTELAEAEVQHEASLAEGQRKQHAREGLERW